MIISLGTGIEVHEKVSLKIGPTRELKIFQTTVANQRAHRQAKALKSRAEWASRARL